jgi:hypothetical protein
VRDGVLALSGRIFSRKEAQKPQKEEEGMNEEGRNFRKDDSAP